MKTKYFTVEVKPTISVEGLAAGNFTDAEILFDWHGFDIPRGAAKLIGVTSRITGKNGVDYSMADIELFWGKSIAGSAPGTLGLDGAAVDTFGWFPNMLGKTYLDASSGSNDGDLIMGNIVAAAAPGGGTLGGSQAVNVPIINMLVLEGEPSSGINKGYDKLYVSALAKGTHNWGASTMEAGSGLATSSPTLAVTDLSPILSGIGPGDILRDEDGRLLGTVKSVDSATSMTMEDNLGFASAAGKLVYNTTPVTLLLSFEK
jgi:hypothetical protein